MKTNHWLLALVVVGLAVWIMRDTNETFSPFYYTVRRDPNEYIRHPLKA